MFYEPTERGSGQQAVLKLTVYSGWVRRFTGGYTFKVSDNV